MRSERNEEDSRRSQYELESLKERIDSSRASRLNLISNELRLDGTGWELSRRSFVGDSDFVILPDNRWYLAWKKFILLWAAYSSFFTPMEFGFFRGLPEKLYLLDIAGQIAFLIDIVVQFFLAYRDSHSYNMVCKRNLIAIRYLKSHFFIDFLGCLPWDSIYRACGRKEEVRYLLWIRLSRVRRVEEFFQEMEKNIRINYLFTRIVKLITVELYCTHTAACIFYYLATTLPESEEGYTWIGSLKLGHYAYTNFRDIDLFKRYITSLYFAIVTMATVGYGDIHAVNIREMIFIMIYVSFDMILGAYLIGNMTALIVKGSKTEKFRDKMTDLIKYMNRNKLGRDIREQVNGHVRLQYESSYTEASVVQELPISIRAKISESLYKPFIEKVPLFKGCSQEFINQIVIKLHEEFFLPGEVILEQGNAVDQIYFVCHGILEGFGIVEDGTEETVLPIESNSSFGEIAILCNIPQPYSVRVLELCRLLRIDKQSFSNILQICFFDGRTILNNLLEGKESSLRIKQLESDITFHITRQEAELALRVNSAAHNGDLHCLKSLIRSGADANKADYDGRTPLHLAASKGYEDITSFLIEGGVNVNVIDDFGNSPLLEAIKNGHDQVVALLVQKEATIHMDDAGNRLCTAVANGDSDFVRRIISHGIDPNSRNYDHRTPLHVAAAEGLFFMAKVLLDAGASVLSKDRWGNTPLDECRISGSKPLINLLETARFSQLKELNKSFHEFRDKMHTKKCTVYPFHPLDQEKRRDGVVLWVPQSIEDLLNSAKEKLNYDGSRILAEDAGEITDTDMISDSQKLYMIE